MVYDLGILRRQRYNPPSLTALGGEYATLYVSSGTSYAVHVFKSSGVFTYPTYMPATNGQLFLVGGGGAGGSNGGGGSQAGGGGAGGVLSSSTYALSPGSRHLITVGAGGAIGTNGGYSNILSPTDTTYSGSFTGSTDYLTLPSSSSAYNLTGDFTVEAWIYATAQSGNDWGIFDARVNGGTPTPWILLLVNTGAGHKVNFYNNGSNFGTTTIPLNTWAHVAVTRSGAALRIFVNGTLDYVNLSYSTAAISPGTTAPRIGSKDATGTSYTTRGYISNLRIVKGTALYTTNFAPPTRALTAVTSPVRHAVSFPGSSYLSAPSSSAFAFGTGDFTIEGWFYGSPDQSTDFMVDFRGGVAVAPAMFVYTSNQLAWFYNGSIVYQPTSLTFTSDSWNHVAIVRSSGVTKFYLNGVGASTTYADTNNYPTAPCILGSDVLAGGSSYWRGQISNFRVVKGLAVYTGNFIPPYTVLPVLTATLPYYVTFNGTTDQLTTVATGLVPTTNPFTIECWVYSTSYGDKGIVAQSAGGAGRLIISINSSGNVNFQIGGTTLTTTGYAIGLNQWTHIALTRVGSTVTVYFNGVSVATGTNATAVDNVLVTIGRVPGYSQYWSGNISNLRIVNGLAVYTGNFTPPTTNLSTTQSAGTNIAAISTASYVTLLTAQSNTIVDNSTYAQTLTPAGTPTVVVTATLWSTSLLTAHTGTIVDGSTYAQTITQVGSPTVISTATLYSTSLLTLQSSTFVDNSGNNFTITPAGSVTTTNTATSIPPLGNTAYGGGAGATGSVGGSGGSLGKSGASGGGSGLWNAGATSIVGGGNIPGQGNAGGGVTSISDNFASGGGGGAGTPGGSGNASTSIGGRGGDGIPTTIISSTIASNANIGEYNTSTGLTYFAGGGGGGGNGTFNVGGLGGGGTDGWSLAATAGRPYSGGGGGGAIGNGGAGGSGVIVLTYPIIKPPTITLTDPYFKYNSLLLTVSPDVYIKGTERPIEYLLVGGGGGGGTGPNFTNNEYTGGGGAGGLVNNSVNLTAGVTYGISVGGGGPGGALNSNGTNGGVSFIFAAPTSAYSGYFNGSTDYVTVPNADSLDLSTGTPSFTIETWFKCTALTSGDQIILNKDGTLNTSYSQYSLGITSAGVLKGSLGTGNGASGGNSESSYGTFVISLNTWYHVAFVNNAGTVNLYVNGVLNVTVPLRGMATGGGPLFIGYANNFASTTRFNGYISNLRIVKGTAVYTTAFTPPVSALTSATTGTSLLTLQDPTFIDNSINNFTITKIGNPLLIPVTLWGESTFAPVIALGGGGGGTTSAAGNNGGSGGGGGNNGAAGGIGQQPTSTSGGYGNSGRSGAGASQPGGGGGGGAGGAAPRVADPGVGLYLANFSAFGESGYFASGGAGSQNGSGGNSSGQFELGGGGGFTSDALWGGGTVVPRSAIAGTGGGGALVYPGASGTGIIRAPETFSVETVTGSPTILTTSGYTYYSWTTSGTIKFQPGRVPLPKNANNVFQDSSSYVRTLTATSTPTQGSFSPFGQNWSNYFNGSTDYLSFPATANMSFGTGDYTIEFWIYPVGTGDFTVIDNQGSGGNMQISRITGTFYHGSASTWTYTFTSDTWTHIAFSRSGTNLRLFANGVLIQTQTNSNVIGSAAGLNTIGHRNDLINKLNGYLSNLRVVKGTALYTSNFTPATAPLPVVTNTVLLTCASNRFMDKSGNTITANGTPRVQRLSPFKLPGEYNSKLLGGSMYFNGSTDYLSSTISAFGTSNFTIEFWLYPVAFNGVGGQGGWFQTSATAGGFQTTYNDGVLLYRNASGNFQILVGGTNIASTYTAVLNTWVHIAITRASGICNLYVNGTSVVTPTSASSSLSGTYLAIGGYYNTTYLMNSYISNFRIINGVAAYVSNFTPRNGPLTSSVVPQPPAPIISPSTVELYAWGGGGGGGRQGGWNYGAAAGAGGAAQGILTVTPLSTYYITVGGAGRVSPAAGVRAAGGGGTPGNDTDNTYGGGGGGYTGLFNSAVSSQGSTILMAGGGGGGGASRAGTGNVGGAGGGTTGQAGTSAYDGNTAYAGVAGGQTVATAGTGGTAGTALQGGSPGTNSYGGSGGGGYWGGGGGGYAEDDTMGGGGGGSGYVNTAYVSSGTLITGSGITPGDSSNTLRGTAGVGGAVATAGNSGTFVIRFPSSIASPYTTGSPVIASSNGYKTITWTNSGTFAFGIAELIENTIANTQTSLLLKGDSASIYDASMNNEIVLVGSGHLSTSVTKNNVRSIYINGTSNYISGPSNPSLSLNGDFTVEMWLYMVSQTSGAELFMAGNFHLNFRNTAGQIAITNDASVLSNLSNTISTGVWTHIAAVRSSGIITIYLNGIANTPSSSQTYSFTQSGWNIGTGGGGFVGYIDDVRVTNGIARYTSNYFALPEFTHPKY